MHSVPRVDETVWYAELGETLVEYKVEAIHWEFWKPASFDVEGIPGTNNCQHTPVVIVKEV